MKKILFLLISFATAFSACKSQKQSTQNGTTPSCIKKTVETFSKTECNKHPNVKEYTFQGKQVFVFDPGQCGADMTSEVIDKECKNLGYLGGFAGNVKINGEDFSNAVFVKTIWEK